MSLRFYIIVMTLSTLVCWYALYFVVWNISPIDFSVLGPLFFYSSLFLAVSGTCSVIGLIIRHRVMHDDDVVLRHIRHAFRQGLLIAVFVVIIAWLQATGWLAWWSALIIALALYLLETVVFAGRKFNNAQYGK